MAAMLKNSPVITDADTVESQNLATHVAMCRMRNETLLKRMGRIEAMTYAAGGSVILAVGKIMMISPEAVTKIGALLLKGG